MSKAARMKRAKGMDFDTDRVVYHGTDKDLSSLKGGQSKYSTDEGVYLTADPEYASGYANSFYDDRIMEGANVMPLHTRLKNPKYVLTKPRSGKGFDADEMKKLMDEGHDGLIVGMTDYEVKMGYKNPADAEEIVVFDPSNIRSTNAAFDPKKSSSSDILAGMAPVGLALSGQGEQQLTPTDYLKGVGHGLAGLPKAISEDFLRAGGYGNALLGNEQSENVPIRAQKINDFVWNALQQGAFGSAPSGIAESLGQKPKDKKTEAAQEKVLSSLAPIIQALAGLPLRPDIGSMTVGDAFAALGPAYEKLPIELRGILEGI